MTIRTPGAERIQDPVALPEDDLDRSLRPERLEDFVGQERVKEQLGVFIEAARARGEALDHVLLAGPPGPPPPRTGADRTSVVLRIDNATEALVSALTELAMQAADPAAHETQALERRYLDMRKTTIYAGSNEIQRNIIAKMTLGL